MERAWHRIGRGVLGVLAVGIVASAPVAPAGATECLFDDEASLLASLELASDGLCQPEDAGAPYQVLNVDFAGKGALVIELTAPLLIPKGSGTISEVHINIDGVEKYLVLKPKSGSEAKFKSGCAVTIQHPGTTITSTKLTGFPGDGICVDADDVWLWDVWVHKTSGMGIRIDADAANTKLERNRLGVTGKGGIEVASGAHHVITKLHVFGPPSAVLHSSDSALAAPVLKGTEYTPTGVRATATAADTPEAVELYFYSKSQNEGFIPAPSADWSCHWTGTAVACDFHHVKWREREIVMMVTTAAGTSKALGPVLLSDGKAGTHPKQDPPPDDVVPPDPNLTPDGKGSDTDDGDADGFADVLDTCPTDFNPSQLDSDGDGLGDACDDAMSFPECVQHTLLGLESCCPEGQAFSFERETCVPEAEISAPLPNKQLAGSPADDSGGGGCSLILR